MSLPARWTRVGTPAPRVERRHLVQLLAVLVTIAVLPYLLPAYPLGLTTLALAYGLFAFGLDIAWGRVGIVSVGHGAFFGIGAYAVAIGTSHDLPGWAGTVLGAVLAAVIALGVGLAGLNIRTIATTMAVLTLGLTLLAEQVAASWLSVTNGSNGIFVPSAGPVGNFYTTAALVVVITAVVWVTVIRGGMGRRMLAVLLNEQRAAHLGVDPYRTKLVALVVSGAVAAAAGGIAAPVMGLVGPSTAGILMSTQVLVWLALGGRGTLAGPFIGALVVTVGQEYLGAAIGSWYQLLMGVLFVLAVKFAPTGLVGLVHRIVRSDTTEPTSRSVVFTPARRRSGPDDGGSDGRPALEAHGIRKAFGAAPVLRDVSLAVRSGEVVCLIGPNGAGKTTFLDVLAGDLTADEGSGSMRLDGQEVSGSRPAARARAGLGKVFQIPSLFLDLSPADNLRLARSLALNDTPLPAEYERFAAMDGAPAVHLPLADKRALELAMVLAWGPELVLLDEPAAGLSHQDSTSLARTLRRISRESGTSILTVEHDMDIVRELADRVVVLAEGAVLVDGSMDDVSQNEDVKRAYLGMV